MTSIQTSSREDDLLSSTVQLIYASFADAPYPSGGQIAERTEGYLTFNGYEGRDVKRFFEGRKWQDVNLETLNHYSGDASACLFFMNTQAFRFYLPSYLIIALTKLGEASRIIDSLMVCLMPQKDLASAGHDGEGRLLSRVSGLSERERHATAKFLLTLQNAYAANLSKTFGPAQALRAFWHRYLEDADKNLIADDIGLEPPSRVELQRKLGSVLSQEAIDKIAAYSQ